MNGERLSHLIEQLRALAEVPLDERERVFDLRGFASCAIGLTARDPWAQAHGFTLKGTSPQFEGRYDWDAVMAYFDVDEDMAAELFLPDSERDENRPLYDTNCQHAPALLAARIEECMRKEMEMVHGASDSALTSQSSLAPG